MPHIQSAHGAEAAAKRKIGHRGGPILKRDHPGESQDYYYLSNRQLFMLKPPERVVILEDDDRLRSTLCDALSDEGFVVVGAAAAKEAVHSAEDSGFDLIVSDIRMAGMDGLDAVAAVRRCLPQIRIIVMTGYASEADSIRALRLGVHDYLRKPFELEDFLAAVQRQIDNHRNEFRLQLVEQSSRALIVWSLESRLGPSKQALRGIGRLTQQVAVQHGLSPAQAQESQILALAEFLRSVGEELDFGLLDDSLRLSCRAWLHQLEEQPEEGENLVLRIARAGLRTMQGLPLEDATLQESFTSVARNPTSVAAPKHWKRRGSLLALAQTCERSDPAEAQRIYQQIAREANPSQETLMAFLGLARLDPQILPTLVQPALALARQVGPVAFAQTSLALALSLGGQEGAALLAPAARIFAQISDLTGSSRVQLAAMVLKNQDQPEERLALLTEFENRATPADWQACTPWLLPYLTRVAAPSPDPALAQFIRRLIRHNGIGAAQPISSLPLDQRQALLVCLQDQASFEQILKAWEKLEPDPQLKKTLSSLIARQSSGSSQMLLKIYTLGPIQLYFGEELLSDSAWANRKHLLLLLYLASVPGRQSEDIIIDRLWPDKDIASGRNNINTALSSIRKVLKNHGAEAALVQRDKLGIWLESGPALWHDLAEFQQCLQNAREAQTEPARQEFLRAACRISRGPFLGGHYYDWAEPVRQLQESSLVEALLQLSEICLRQEQYLEALEHSHRLLEMDPCCQNACHMAMRSYLALSRAEEAVRMFERSKRSLQEELGIEPITALIEMRERALISLSSIPRGG